MGPYAPLSGAPPVPYVPLRVTSGVLFWLNIGVRWCLLAAEPRSTAGLYSHLCVSVERSRRPCIRWYGTGGFEKQGQCFLIGLSCSLPFGLPPFPFFFFLSIEWFCGARVFGLIGCKSFSPSLAFQIYFNDNNNNDNNQIHHKHQGLSY